MADVRVQIARARRVVVQIGSRTLAGDRGIFARLASSIGARKGTSFVVVSSGAIALGMKKLGYRTRPKEMARLQAAAAAGQSLLMRAYEEAFDAEGLTVAQVLLTHADLADRARANNARSALGALLDAARIPILNENDSVAVDEINFGDNDQLASMVAPLVDAELVILLSDVDGLLDGSGTRIPIIGDVAAEALPHVRKSTGGVGSGGMASKVEAARRATLAGANVVVADARVPGILDAILRGEDVGTLFVGSRRTAEREEVLDRLHTAPSRRHRPRSRARRRPCGPRARACSRSGFWASAATFALATRCGSWTRTQRRSHGAWRGVAPERRPGSPARHAKSCRPNSPEMAVMVHADELVVGGHT